jgi:hypothetical protein
MRGVGGILVGARETVGKNLASAGRPFTLERLEAGPIYPPLPTKTGVAAVCY